MAAVQVHDRDAGDHTGEHLQLPPGAEEVRPRNAHDDLWVPQLDDEANVLVSGHRYRNQRPVVVPLVFLRVGQAHSQEVLIPFLLLLGVHHCLDDGVLGVCGGRAVQDGIAEAARGEIHGVGLKGADPVPRSSGRALPEGALLPKLGHRVGQRQWCAAGGDRQVQRPVQGVVLLETLGVAALHEVARQRFPSKLHLEVHVEHGGEVRRGVGVLN
mmetsp:Transcript_29124/g.49662  ORF Transcript_29124/g.49662 Transcript_29124/m.49662 type:complete len:214 (+) Transcript_29124:762-1403(+)